LKSLHADPSAADDELLIPALRRGDEAAFRELLDRHGGGMLRFAMLYTADPAIAEDAVQDTWMGVLTGIVRFEHRSSLKTWIYSILLNRVRSRTKREGRLIPFSALFDASACPDEPAVEPERFAPPDHPRAPGHWYSVHAPKSWGESPETRMLSKEVRTLVDEAIRTLPPAQAEVITLRDREGWSSSEVCSVLGIGESNQRVLLHRARSRVRRALERYLLEG
jgi:RNA polymerase sigma-70 factor (ECF subfamily)